MPGMTGAVLAHCIKIRSPSTPVVLMTGSGIEIVLSQKGTAVDRVLFKPFTLSEIDKTIRDLFGIRG
jgi:FixJ family two-component response regulator